MIQGLYTALITPFHNGKVDEKTFQQFVEWQISEGVHGLVPCGTTGESPTLSHEEHNRVIDMTIEVAKGRVQVMAGTGSNSTDEAIMTTRHAKKSGADSALIVAPYYNKPTQEGLYQHFKAIHDAVEIPIIVYNVPGRSTVNISDDTLARLSALPNIVGVKDATGDLARVHSLRYKLRSSAAQAAPLNGPSRREDAPPKEFAILSGEDMTAVAFNAIGGVGCISVASNIMPKACAAVQNACLAGDWKLALALQDKLVALHDVMFCETSPGPVKYAASLLGKCSAEMRLPLVSISDANKKSVEQVLSNLGLL